MTLEEALTELPDANDCIKCKKKPLVTTMKMDYNYSMLSIECCCFSRVRVFFDVSDSKIEQERRTKEYVIDIIKAWNKFNSPEESK